jgi:parallel beta-helix repeat protein
VVAGRLAVQRLAEVVEAEQQPDAGRDLVVGRVRRLAAQHARGEPAVDLVEQARQRSQVALANDLTGCPADGLVVGADAITIDLNGHTIDGTTEPVQDCDSVEFGGPSGIDNQAGHDDLRVENGTVKQFAIGFSAGSDSGGMVGGRLQRLTLRDNRFNGIDIGSPGLQNADEVIEHNLIVGNGCAFGIALSGVQRTKVAHNQVIDNGLGILLCCSDHNVIEQNLVSGTDHDAMIICRSNDSHNVVRDNAVTRSAEAGIDLCCDGSDLGAVVAANTTANNAGAGIQLEGVNGSEIVDNKALSDGDGIVGAGDGNTIAGNHVTNAGGCPDGCGFGISFEGGRNGLIARNDVSGTVRDGIRIESFAPDTPPTVGLVVRDNHVRGAEVDGYSVGTEVGGPISGLLLQGNSAQGSGDDGFDVRSPGTTLAEKRASHNADLGIEAVAGFTDRGGNRAFGNGNPLQCANVACGK